MSKSNELHVQRAVHVRVIQTINNFQEKKLQCLKSLSFKKLRKSVSSLLILRQTENK